MRASYLLAAGSLRVGVPQPESWDYVGGGGMRDGDPVGASAPSEQTSCMCGPDHVNEVQN